MADFTKEIISVVRLGKRQTRCCIVIMKREAFIQTVEKLSSEVRIVEVCPDWSPYE